MKVLSKERTGLGVTRNSGIRTQHLHQAFQTCQVRQRIFVVSKFRPDIFPIWRKGGDVKPVSGGKLNPRLETRNIFSFVGCDVIVIYLVMFLQFLSKYIFIK